MDVETMFWKYFGPISVSGFCAVMAWGLGAMWRMIVDLRKRLDSFEEKMADTYVRRKELERIEDRVVAEIRKLDSSMERHAENSLDRWKETLLKQRE